MRKLIERYCEDNGIEDILFMDGMDKAIMGLSSCFHHAKVVYSYNKIIKILQKSMSYDEAVEYFHFNIEGAYVGDGTPIIMRDDICWKQ